MSASAIMSRIINGNEFRLVRFPRPRVHVRTERDELRRECRVFSNDRIFAQIVACEDYPELIGVTMSCVSQDVSTHGLKIKSYTYIPAGCLLDLWVDGNRRPGKFYLNSTVRWVREKAELKHTYVLGVELNEDPATDFEAWSRLYG